MGRTKLPIDPNKCTYSDLESNDGQQEPEAISTRMGVWDNQLGKVLLDIGM